MTPESKTANRIPLFLITEAIERNTGFQRAIDFFAPVDAVPLPTT